MRIVFRADGNSKIGLGHIVRLLAIAEMLPIEYEKLFMVRNPDVSLEEMINEYGIKIIPLENFSDYIEEANLIRNNFVDDKDILVLDGYNFSEDYQRVIGEEGNQIVLISDYPQGKTIADVLINHSGGITIENYDSSSYSRFYLGPNYALLRSAFFKKHTPSNNEGIERILVCFGGADPQNFSLKMSLMLRGAGFEGMIHFIVGSVYLHYHQLIKEAEGQVEISQNLSTKKMAESIFKADLVICPASSISYEVCSLRRPMITGVSAENQQKLYNFLTTEDLACGIDNFNDINVSILKKALEYLKDKKNCHRQLSAQELQFDQNSKQRFQKIFQKLELISSVQIRKAQTEDSSLLFQWVNDPEARKTAINQEPITLKTHIAWFEGLLNDVNRYLYIIHLDSKPIGQVRFDKQEDGYVLSYSLDSNYRGRGFGEVLIRKAVKTLTNQLGTDPTILAIVKVDNAVSNKIFEKNHFILTEKKEISGTIFFTYTRG